MSTQPQTLAAAVRAHAAAVLAVTDAARDAGLVQFDAPRGPSHEPNDTSPSRTGNHGDPTGTTATDGRRLRLRAAYQAAIGDVENATARLHVAERLLRDALTDWESANRASTPIAA